MTNETIHSKQSVSGVLSVKVWTLGAFSVIFSIIVKISCLPLS